MPRPLRILPGGCVAHAVNRGNDKRVLFDNARDYEEFLWLVTWAKRKCSIRILAYCVMPNHWHFVLWPLSDDDVSIFLHALTSTHAIRRRRRTGTTGLGHIYQHRFHAAVIDTEAYYWNAFRYVESNPLRANLVTSSAYWQWSSIYERRGRSREILDQGPFALPDNWLEVVDSSIPDTALAEIRSDLRKH